MTNIRLGLVGAGNFLPSFAPLFAAHPGRVYSRKYLLENIWDYTYSGYDRTIDSHINRLRAKIEENPDEPKLVLTVWGVGYKFNDESD